MRLLSLFHAVTPIMTGGDITIFQAPAQDSNMAGNWENRLCLKARWLTLMPGWDLSGSLSSEQYARYRGTGKVLETQDP